MPRPRRSAARRLLGVKRTVRGATKPAPVDPLKLRVAVAAALAAFEACIKHARGEKLREEAAAQAAALSGLGMTVGVTKTRMSERLRWDWLASTWATLDGSPDARLAAECSRLAGEAAALAHL